MRHVLLPLLLGACAALGGCGPTITVHHKVDPIFVNVTINHRIQRELEEFFAFEKTRGKAADAESASP